MKKIIFWGDGILSGPSGYAELLGSHVLLHHPRADLSYSTVHALPSPGGEGPAGPASRGSLAEAFRDAPFHAIGKDPNLLYLGFGYEDVRAGHGVEEILRILGDLAALVGQKSHARLVMPTVISAFFSEEGERERVHALNAGLRRMASPRLAVPDLEQVVEDFLRQHRESPGDQRALHLDSSRLTPLGQLLLAHHAYRLAPWPDFREAPEPARA